MQVHLQELQLKPDWRLAVSDRNYKLEDCLPSATPLCRFLTHHKMVLTLLLESCSYSILKKVLPPCDGVASNNYTRRRGCRKEHSGA